MTNLSERLRQIERNPSPDLWDEIVARTVDAEVRSSGPSSRRLAIIAASLAIGLAAVAFVAFAFRQPSTPPAPVDQPFVMPKNSCELVTVSEVETATHSMVTQSGLLTDDQLHPPYTRPNPCQYETDDEHTSLTVWVRPDDVDGFAKIRDQDRTNVVMLPGLGDEAFSVGRRSVWVRVGSDYFIIVSRHGASEEGVTELQALARLALGSNSAPRPAEVPFADLPQGWSELQAPPEVRCCAATAWTGSELLIWGGHVGQTDKSEASGLIYDATDDAWTEMPASPLGARSLPGGVWTGREFLVWGGADFTTRYPYEQYADGAAFDPSSGTWRMLPPAPIDAREPFVVWTGEEMIVWGNQEREDRKVDGAAYDPDSDTWRLIADAPIELTDAAASWTGSEMIVLGAALHGGNIPETPSAIGAAYDPATDSWRTIADSDINTNANDSIWIGDRLLAWDYDLATQTYDPELDRWTDAGRAPTDECEDVPSTVFAGSAFGRLCGDLVRFDGTDSAWSLVEDPAKAFFPLELFGAGDVLLVASVAGPFGEGEDWQLFAFRTPTQSDEVAPLAGTSWLLTSVDGRDWPVGDAPDATLVFRQTRLNGYSGCNRFGARWRLVDGVIEVTNLLSTMVACGGDVGWAERRLFKIMSASPTVGNGGVDELRLTALPQGVLQFVPLPQV